MLPTSNEKPGATEPICLISYQITHILLGGGPDSRTSFWKSYRREFELNQKTDYKNYHTHLCKHYLAELKPDGKPVYFRDNRLTTGKNTPTGLNLNAPVVADSIDPL